MMRKTVQIVTDDGSTFISYMDAKKYLEVEYGKKLTKLASELLQIEKYLNMCEFLEVNLEKFHELLTIKEEFEQKEECLLYEEV